MPDHAIPQRPIGENDEVLLHANGQQWLLTWHGPLFAPTGKPHGSAGICATPERQIVLISPDGAHWDWPAGRPEGSEDYQATLRREVREEACATVLTARLLGFSRGHCIHGPEQGLILVRAIWLAQVALQPWDPRFEIRHRQLVPIADLFCHLTIADGYLPTYCRALLEAGLT